MSNRKKESLVWGIILVIIGVIFLLQNFNIGVWRTLINLWPLILIGWGIKKIYLGLEEKRSNKTEP